MDTISTKHKRIILQPRDKTLLDALRVLRVADRDHASRVAGFTSPSRAKARLWALVCAGYLDRFFVGTIKGGRKAVYRLPSGRVRPTSRLLASPDTERFVEHELWITEAFLAIGLGPYTLASWERIPSPIPDSTGVIPDALAVLRREGEQRIAFLEMDLGTESRPVWERKVHGYLRLARSSYCMDRFGVPSFRVFVIARGEDRIQAIRSVIARSTNRVFWLASTDVIKAHGFWSPVWLRPSGDQQVEPL